MAEAALAIDPSHPAFFDLSRVPLELPLPDDDDDLAWGDDLGFGGYDFIFDPDFNPDDLICAPDEDDPAAAAASDGSPIPDAASSGGDPGSSQSGEEPPSPDSGLSAAESPDSGVTSDVARADPGLKRRMEDDGDDEKGNPSHGHRSRKPWRSEDVASPPADGGGAGVEDKHRARLKRNRESAQLSRQRKKHYVEELEEKVRSMHSTISELNGKISFVMAENASLRQQLSGGNGGGGGIPTPPSAGIFPPMPHMPYPWLPRYAIGPQGSQVPLLPIPRWKPQQPAPASKPRKPASKPADGKKKKVASFSLLGLFFILLFHGSVVPGVYLGGFGGRGVVKDANLGQFNGKALGVIGLSNSHGNATDGIGFYHGKMGLARDGSASTQNSSESLPALLYVPKNGKHVQINGNLIIRSVLASERSMEKASSGAHAREVEGSSGKDVKGTLLGSVDKLASALVIKDGSEVGKSRVVASNSGDPLRSNPADRPPQQWFLEEMAGPILNSGMCTEVFQFEVSPSSSDADPTGIIVPAAAAAAPGVNSTDNKLPSKRLRNRRILSSDPVPLSGGGGSPPLNRTGGFREYRPGGVNGSLPAGNKSSSSMIVSVLADPREGGDGDGVEGMISPPPHKKSLSRIFVVVLLDSVKYVTYSCVLPLRSSGPQLVN